MTIGTIASVVCSLILLTFVVKFVNRKIRNHIDSQIYCTLSEVLNIPIEDIVKLDFHEDIDTTIRILQIIMESVKNKVDDFRNINGLNFEEIVQSCFNFTTEKCKKYEIEINENIEFSIREVISRYLKIESDKKIQ